MLFWLDGDDDVLRIVAQAGFAAEFLTSPEPAASLDLVARESPACVLVDAYTLDAAYFTILRPYVDCLAVIDDLADRDLDADLVVNGSANAAALTYRLTPSCDLLLGTWYALLRPSFRGLPARDTPERVRCVLITLGGADPTGSTASVMTDVAGALPRARLNVVIGPLFRSPEQLRQVAAGLGDRVVLHLAPDDLVDLMMGADLAVSAGGQTLYELAACGVPTLALRVAENQRRQMDALSRMNIVRDGGVCDEAGRFSAVRDEVTALDADRSLRSAMSELGQRLVDGLGAQRVADAILDRLEGGRRQRRVAR